jgi:hypothetical protein
VPGTSYRPLDTEGPPGEPSQLQRFRNAAKAGSTLEELVGLVAIDTGLRASAIAHLTDEWIDDRGDRYQIDVPPFQKCRVGVKNDGCGGDTTNRNVPCYDCQGRPTDVDWLPNQLPDGGNCWRPKSKAGYEGRTLPVKEEDTQRILQSFFRVNDVVGSRGTVCNRVKDIARRAGVEEVTVDEYGNTQFWSTS